MRQVAPVLFQRLIFALRILVGHALRSAHLLQRLHQFVTRDARALKQADRPHIGAGEREQVMLGAGKFVFEFGHLFFGRIQGDAQLVVQPQLNAGPFHFRASLQFGAKLAANFIDSHTHLLEKRARHSVCLISQRQKEMLVAHFRMAQFRSDILGRLQGLLHLLRELVYAHASK